MAAGPTRRRDDAGDLRVQRTRQALLEAFITLVQERGFDAVTVRDLTARAMVNRATFYRHFRDKHDLLRWSVDRSFADLAWRPVPSDPSEFSFDDAVDHAEAVLTRLAKHADLFRTVLALGGGPRLALKAQRFMEAVIDHRLEAIGGCESVIPREMLVPVMSRWAMALFSWWLQEGMPYPPREMAVYTIMLFSLGPYRCLGFDHLVPDDLNAVAGARQGT